MKFTKDALHKLLPNAAKQIRLLGVVAIDPDWESLAEVWSETKRKNSDFTITVLCESDNMLFSKAFTSDTSGVHKRRSFRELRFIRDRALELPRLLEKAPGMGSGDTGAEVEVMHLHIPVSIVQIDERVFANLWLHELSLEFEEVTNDHAWKVALDSYIESYFRKEIGRKYSCEADEEILELYDHDRIPRGIYPRGSFYDTDYSQLVVWALVFDRKGRLLLHRRSDNAKDNQGMWDKSVGGHVDFALDLDTSRAVVREVIEQLFSEETHHKVELRAWAVSDTDVVNMGEWRPNQRRRQPFLEIAELKREWAFFRLRDSQRVYSPRELSNGRMRRLRVIADVFLFIAGPNLSDDSLGELKNSQFKLLELSELKNVMDSALRNEAVVGFDNSNAVPRFTPDLTNIMTGELRDVLEDFAQYVKRYLHNKT